MPAPTNTIIRFHDLANRKPTQFEIEPDAAERKLIAQELDIDSLRKLRFIGKITPDGASDWSLTAQLGATVVQPCVITLDPVTTRIDETVERRYRAHMPEIDAAEMEMDGNDTDEAIPATLDLKSVMIEALSLALPAYPRKTDASVEQTVFSEPGVAPLTDEDAKPFAGLEAFKQRLTQTNDKKNDS